MIVAVAMKTKEGKIRVCRNCHVELMILFPDEFKHAEQGFLTSECEFVDRKKGLEIAKKYNQIIEKHGLDTELYSEDIFWNEKVSD
jgi:hypothetical protein